ncbi:MAG: hypothetical protein KTR18_08470 [Acidiferrobacterales bacterium]|nr:hypothetical protein [Acidiferrobacterales bacterium]
MAIFLVVLISSPVAADPNADAIAKLTDNLETIERIELDSGKLGLGLIPRDYNVSVASWAESLKLAKKLGVHAIQIPSGYWNEDEPVKDAYQWQSMVSLMNAIDAGNFEFEIIQDFGGPFFHDRITAPQYIQTRKLDNAELVDRYIKYVDAYLNLFGNQIQVFLVHAEGAYSFFAAHPESLEHYLTLLVKKRNHIREKWPHIQFGINTDPHNTASLLAVLSAPLDIIAFDLVQIDGFMEEPREFGSALQYVLQNTNGKDISFAAGWSSSATSGGEEAQMEYVREVFDALEKPENRIRYAIFGPLFDEQVEIVGPAYRAQFSTLPQDFVTDIIEWITTLGLIKSDGTIKPSFKVAQSRASNYFRSKQRQLPD